MVDTESGSVNYAGNLPADWSGVSITKEITSSTGLACHLENDANSFALAESTYGAGKSKGNIFCVSGGAGSHQAEQINGGRYINGCDFAISRLNS